MKDVTFLIPAYNEEKSIGTLLKDIRCSYPYSNVVVVDNNSTDRTSEIASKYGARILYEKKQGKGYAIRKGFENINSKYILMLDADYTYRPADGKKLIKSLKENKADVILGSRLNDNREKGSITALNLLGNYILSFTTSLLYSKISDVCTGYWAFKREVVEQLVKDGISSNGFELEVEMFVKIFQNEFRISEVPITYGKRIDEPKLNSIKDGWRIFKTICSYKLNNNDNNAELVTKDKQEVNNSAKKT